MATPVAAAGWPGTYDLVAIGAPADRSRAVVTVTPRDTGYAMALEGPVGRLVSQRFSGDSAYSVWLVAEGDTLVTELRLMGDSLRGRLRGPKQSGTGWQVLEGRRRR